MLAVALDHHGAESRCAAERVERRQQRLDQLAVVGIVDLGAVEGDGGDAAPVDAPQHRAGCVRWISCAGWIHSAVIADCGARISGLCTAVIAREGGRSSKLSAGDYWMPAFAGMTDWTSWQPSLRTTVVPDQSRSGNRMMKLSRFGICTFGRLSASIASFSPMILF